MPNMASRMLGNVQEGLVRSGQLPGGGFAGEAGYESNFYGDWKGYSIDWLTDIDNIIDTTGMFMVRSPYATFEAAKAISAITSAADVKVTTGAAHSYNDGDMILLVGIAAAADAADPWKELFRLNGQVFKIRGASGSDFYLEGVYGVNLTAHTASTGWAIKVTPIIAYDPDTEIAAAQTEVGEYNTAVDALDPFGATGDMHDAVARAVAEAAIILTDDTLSGAVDSYIDRIDEKYAPRMRSFSAGMCDIGACNSTGFMVGHAFLEYEKRKEVKDFHQKLSLMWEEKRAEIALALAGRMIDFEQFRVESLKAVAQVQGDASREKINIKGDEEELNRVLTLKNALWPLDRFQYGFNAIGAMQGAVGPVASSEGKDNRLSAGGALSGAAVGAQIGTAAAGPGLGTAVGAGVGAVIGLFA